MARLVPIDPDWTRDPWFGRIFTQELAALIEETISRNIEFLNPVAEPSRVRGTYRVVVTGDGKLEVQRVGRAGDLRLGFRPPESRSSLVPQPDVPSPMDTQDPVKSAIDEAMDRIPTVIQRTREIIQRRAPVLREQSQEGVLAP